MPETGWAEKEYSIPEEHEREPGANIQSTSHHCSPRGTRGGGERSEEKAEGGKGRKGEASKGEGEGECRIKVTVRVSMNEC